MNNVVLSGRLTVVPEVKFTKSGKEVVNASIAVNRNRKDANGERIVDFFDFTVWGQTAQYLAKFADKGARIEISGALRQQKYTNVAGQIVYSVYDAKDARSMRRVVSSLRRYGTLNACGIEESSSDDEHLEYVAEQAEVSKMNDILQGDYLVKRIRDGIEVALELGATSDQLKHWSESQPSKSVLKELSDFITATKQA